MSAIVKILSEDEDEDNPAVFDVELLLSDGSKHKQRMSVFQLQELRQKLGMPPLPS